MNKPDKELTFNRLIASIRQIHDQMAALAGKAINISLTLFFNILTLSDKTV